MMGNGTSILRRQVVNATYPHVALATYIGDAMIGALPFSNLRFMRFTTKKRSRVGVPRCSECRHGLCGACGACHNPDDHYGFIRPNFLCWDRYCCRSQRDRRSQPRLRFQNWAHDVLASCPSRAVAAHRHRRLTQPTLRDATQHAPRLCLAGGRSTWRGGEDSGRRRQA
jgi:hypothetical protein